jgi:predicted nucleic acid-binding protein
LQTRYVVDTTILVSSLLNPNKLTGKIVRSLELQLFTLC